MIKVQDSMSDAQLGAVIDLSHDCGCCPRYELKNAHELGSDRGCLLALV